MAEPQKVQELASIEIGFEPEPFEREVDLANWNRYAAVNDEFVPIHMDDAAGQEAGYPTAFGMGNLHVSYLHNFLYQWVSDHGHVAHLEVRFRRPSIRGILNRASGVVTAVRKEGDRTLIDLDVWVEDGDGEQLTQGAATVQVGG